MLDEPPAPRKTDLRELFRPLSDQVEHAIRAGVLRRLAQSRMLSGRPLAELDVGSGLSGEEGGGRPLSDGRPTLTSDDGIRFKTGGESASSRLPGDVAEASGSSLGPVGDVDGEKDFNRASRMRASLIRACESKF